MIKGKQHPDYGVLRYDGDGLPICHICGLSFHRLGRHISLKHEMTAREYKLLFGLFRSKGLISKESADRIREKVHANYGKAIVNNLLIKGAKTRYEAGHEGRTAEMVGQQCRNMLSEHGKRIVSKERAAELGKALGKSGKGNAARWGLKP